jgi:acetyl esterase/lipase
MRILSWLVLSLTLCAQAFELKVPDWVSTQRNLSYSGHPSNVLDVYQSKRSNGSGKMPAVLVIHGGGWVGGEKDRVFERLCLPFLEKGFVVVNVEYRLAKDALAPAAVEDALVAAEWLRTNSAKYNIDRNRIVVTGDSAGGHLALMVGLATKQAKLGPTGKVAAVVNWYGISDVQDQLEGEHRRDYAVTWAPESLPDRQEVSRRVSPRSWIRKDAPPVLSIHGDADPVVPYEHSVDLTKELRTAGADAELLVVRQGEHGNFPPEETARLWQQIWTFLAKRKII